MIPEPFANRSGGFTKDSAWNKEGNKEGNKEVEGNAFETSSSHLQQRAAGDEEEGAKSGRRWPAAAWNAINQLAETDLARYDAKPIYDPEMFLRTARARRLERHRSLIDSLLAVNPHLDASVIVAACEPAPKVKPDPLAGTARAAEVIFAHNDERREPPPAAPPACELCANTGRLPEGCCGCERGQVVALIDRMRHKEPA